MNLPSNLPCYTVFFGGGIWGFGDEDDEDDAADDDDDDDDDDEIYLIKTFYVQLVCPWIRWIKKGVKRHAVYANGGSVAHSQ